MATLSLPALRVRLCTCPDALASCYLGFLLKWQWSPVPPPSLPCPP